MIMAATTQRTATLKTSGRDSKGSWNSPPVPQQLATPTDLAPDAVQAVTKVINPIVADAFALYVKLKNFHWHLAGSHFRDYHLLFDEHADQLLASIDPLAERVRRIGGTTIRSVSHISDIQTIDDDNTDFVSPREMVQHLIGDNRHIAETMRAAMELCDEQRDHSTSNLLQELLDETEKRIWFLYEVSQGGENTE
jgi:starvation-inducible DNA-binding protein